MAFMDTEQTREPLTIAAAGEAWAVAQRARRKPLAEPTIASYRDAWRSFSSWAAKNEKRLVAEIGVTDLGHWIDSLSRKADGTALTYSHGALAVCKFLADRGELVCDLALLRMHLRDALPRAPMVNRSTVTAMLGYRSFLYRRMAPRGSWIDPVIFITAWSSIGPWTFSNSSLRMLTTMSA